MPTILEFGAQCGVPGARTALTVEQARQPPPPAAAPAAPADPCELALGADIAAGLWPPGSLEFCQHADEVGKGLADLYERIAEWITGKNPTADFFDQLKIDEPQGKLLAPVAAIFHLWNLAMEALRDSVGVLIDRFRGLLRSITQLVKCVAGRCNAPAYLGAWALWQTVRLFRDTDLGWELGPRFTLRVELDFPGLVDWIQSLMRFYCPAEPPGADEATEAWLRDLIDETQRDCVWRLHGINPVTYSNFALARREQLDWREAIQYTRRLHLGDNAETEALRKRGFVTQADVDMAREMFWELPGIADHLHWLQRQVFDADYVARYRLMEGFKDKFWPAFGDDLTALGMRQRYAEYHYAAHWIMPSPEQMRTFVYRSDEIQAVTGQPFTLDDLERILAEQDYNVLARQWFRATAYQVPAVSYVKAMFQQGVIGPGDLATYHKRLGYSQEDANRFADIDRLQAARMRAAQTGGWTTRAANQAWWADQITADRHGEIFAGLGYTPEEARHAREVTDTTIRVQVARRAFTRSVSSLTKTMTDAVQVGVLSPDDASKQLQQSGWPKNLADAFAANQAAVSNVQRVKQAVAFIRQHTLDGSITPIQAQAELQRLGLTQQSITGYLFTWRVKQTVRRKQLTAQKISGAVAKGRMTTAEAMVRLTNLGYNNADALLYLADAQAALTKAEAARVAAEGKGLKARQKALQQAATAAEKVKKQAVASMVRDMPVAKLEKWLKLGLISRANFAARMRLYGFSETDISLRINEVCHAKTAACTDQQIRITGLEAGGAGGGPPGK